MEFSFLSFLIGTAIGLLAGAIAVWQWQRSRPQVQSANKLAREHEQLKQQVADHFVETAQRVNQLTDSYKDVMEHLRHGATTLVDRETLEKRLPALEDADVRVARIGAKERPQAAHSEESPADAEKNPD